MYTLVDKNKSSFLPLTYSRPISSLRVGILTIKEKWELALNQEVGVKSDEYLGMNLHLNGEEKDASILPSSNKLNNIWDIYVLNAIEISNDFSALIKGRKSNKISNTNKIIGEKSLIFVEDGATIEASILNTKSGPIYVGKNAKIMEGSMIRGPFALCEGGVVKMGTKIYSGTTVGPYSKVGGELNNVVIQGFSNKAHDGFLGNSVIGEWCNIGADSNNSNLKNNYEEVKLWCYDEEKFINTKRQFCGLFMGDHSKFGINTMVNTGTIIGFSVNLFGSGFPRNFIPSFSWGGTSGFKTYQLKKAIETAKLVMQRRDKIFSNKDTRIFNHIYNQTSKYR